MKIIVDKAGGKKEVVPTCLRKIGISRCKREYGSRLKLRKSD